ncbi:hypothetical protein EJB05_03882, partial [Eragrostis curvula]
LSHSSVSVRRPVEPGPAPRSALLGARRRAPRAGRTAPAPPAFDKGASPLRRRHRRKAGSATPPLGTRRQVLPLLLRFAFDPRVLGTMTPYLLLHKGASLARSNTLRLYGTSKAQGPMSSLVRRLSSSPRSNSWSWGVPALYGDENLEPVESFIDKYPILCKVPTDRLINVKPHHQYMATEKGNVFLWSSGMIPFLSHEEGVSTSGLFKRGTLGVWKPLGVLGVKDFVPESKPLDEKLVRENYGELHEYLTWLLRKHYGPNILKMTLPDINGWLDSMIAPQIDAEMIAFDPSRLPRKEKGLLILDIHRHLRKEMPLSGKVDQVIASKILAAIPDDIEKAGDNELMQWPDTARQNIFLEHWSSHWSIQNQNNTRGNSCSLVTASQKKLKPDKSSISSQHEKDKAISTSYCSNDSSNGTKSTKSNYIRNRKMKSRNKYRRNLRNTCNSDNDSSNQNVKEESIMQQKQEALRKLGASLVDLHRNSISHIFERRLKKLIQKLSKKRRASLKKKPYTIEEVLDLLQYEFPKYLPRVLLAIRKYCKPLWIKIAIRRRFPLVSPLYRKR